MLRSRKEGRLCSQDPVHFPEHVHTPLLSLIPPPLSFQSNSSSEVVACCPHLQVRKLGPNRLNWLMQPESRRLGLSPGLGALLVLCVQGLRGVRLWGLRTRLQVMCSRSRQGGHDLTASSC